ncbi:Tripartite motif-containing protein 45 [Gryllus bimaculatus]|nr:Tripartite motif-containing protein 45 [Gryllus bimaculatus]
MENLLEMCANVAVLIKFAALSRRGRAKRNGAGARRVCGWLVCAGGGGGALAARWQGGRPLACRAGGVGALPPNYLAQHRIVLASLNKATTRLLCDVCPGERPARRLERVAGDASAAVAFADDLLAEASDAEVLSLAAPVLRRLQGVAAPADGAKLQQLLEAPRVSEELAFMAGEGAGLVGGFPLVGVVSTQAACPARCTLLAAGAYIPPRGLHAMSGSCVGGPAIPNEMDRRPTDVFSGALRRALLDCRVHKRTEVVLQTRDNDGEPLCHGGEKIAAELRHRDASSREVLFPYWCEFKRLIRGSTIAAAFVPVEETRRLLVDVGLLCQEVTWDVVMDILGILAVVIGLVVGMCWRIQSVQPGDAATLQFISSHYRRLQ